MATVTPGTLRRRESGHDGDGDPLGAMRATAGHDGNGDPQAFRHDGDGFSPDKELKRAQEKNSHKGENWLVGCHIGHDGDEGLVGKAIRP